MQVGDVEGIVELIRVTNQAGLLAHCDNAGGRHVGIGIMVAAIAAIAIMLVAALAMPVRAFADDTTTKDYAYSADPSKYKWVQLDQNTYTMDTDGDGVPDVTLVKNGDTWVYTFNVEDANREYYVYEQMLGGLANQGYTSSGSDGATALPNDPGKTSTKTYTITNSKAHPTQQTGSLKVSKTVTNTTVPASLARKFAFTITLTASDTATQSLISGSKIFGSVPFVNGVATISLSNGESVTMDGIPAGVSYTVTEQSVSGFETTKTGDTGTIANGVTSEVAFTNKRTYRGDALAYVPVTITKSVTGTPKSSSDVYTMHAALTGLPAGMIVTLSNGQSVTAADDGTADITFQLTDGGSVTINDIPVGAQYVVTEDGGSWYPSYTVTDANASSSGGEVIQAPWDDNPAGAEAVLFTAASTTSASVPGTGTIASSSGSATTTDTPLSTAKETAETGEDITIAFTNQIHKVQSLTISKVVKDALGNVVTSDNGSDGKPIKYTIEIMMSGLPGNSTLSSSIGSMDADDNGDIDMLAYLANGESITITDVPVGTRYRFVEQANDKVGSYAISVADGQTGTFVRQSATGTGTNTAIATGTLGSGSLGDGDETVDEGEDATVTFTNSIPLIFTMPFTGSTQVIAIAMSFAGAVALMTVAITHATSTKDGNGRRRQP